MTKFAFQHGHNKTKHLRCWAGMQMAAHRLQDFRPLQTEARPEDKAKGLTPEMLDGCMF